MRAVYRICGHQTLIPQSLVIPLSYPTGDPLCHGRFGEVWKVRHQDQEVAVKVVKVYTMDDLRQTKSVGFSWSFDLI